MKSISHDTIISPVAAEDPFLTQSFKPCMYTAYTLMTRNNIAIKNVK